MNEQVNQCKKEIRNLVNSYNLDTVLVSLNQIFTELVEASKETQIQEKRLFQKQRESIVLLAKNRWDIWKHLSKEQIT